MSSKPSDSCLGILVGIVIVVAVFAVVIGGNLISRRINLGAGSPPQPFYFPPGGGVSTLPAPTFTSQNIDIARSNVGSMIKSGNIAEPSILNPPAKLGQTYVRPGEAQALGSYGSYDNAYTPLKGYSMNYGTKTLGSVNTMNYGPAKSVLGYSLNSKAEDSKYDFPPLPRANLSASFQDPSDPSTFIKNQPLVMPLRQKVQGVDYVRGDVYIAPIQRGWMDVRKGVQDLEVGGHGIIFGESGGQGYGQQPLGGCGCGGAAPPMALGGEWQKPPSILGANDEWKRPLPTLGADSALISQYKQ